MIQTGDLILFKGKGPAFTIWSFLLGLLDKSWRQREFKPGHIAIAHSVETNHTWKIVDATAKGVDYNDLELSRDDYRVYHWLDNPPSLPRFNRWLSNYLGCKYDYDAYIGTGISIIFKKLLGWSFKHIDREYYCFEFADIFCWEHGKPLTEFNQYPDPSTVISALETS